MHPPSPSVCLSVYLSVCLVTCLCVCLSACLSACLLILSVYQSVCLNDSPSSSFSYAAYSVISPDVRPPEVPIPPTVARPPKVQGGERELKRNGSCSQSVLKA